MCVHTNEYMCSYAYTHTHKHTYSLSLSLSLSLSHIGSRDKYGGTALHWAAGKGRTRCVKLLIDS